MGRRKRALAASEDEEVSSENEDEVEEEIVDVDFEFFDPKPEDFHGIKALLRTYLHETEWDSASFVDLILSQTTVGTVVKAGEDESPIGFVTALNINRHRENAGVQAIGRFLMNKSNSEELQALWSSNKNVGLVVCERFVNVPVQVCLPLYQALFDEISWATEDEPSAELRDSFKFDHYLIFTRVYQEVPHKKKNKNRKRSKQSDEGELLFIKPEDELFLQLSTFSSTFPVKAGALAARETNGLKLFALVMAVKASRIESFKTKLQELAAAE